MTLHVLEADRTADEKESPCISTKFASTDDESWIDVDTSNTLPLRKWFHSNDYTGVD